MAHAIPDDVAVYLMRPLSPEEEAVALRYLNIIELVIRREVPDLVTRAATDADFGSTLAYIEASVVADILRNPERLQYEQAGDYAYSLQKVLQVDSLRKAISDDMWWLLGVHRGGAFTVETAVFSQDAGRAPRWWSTIAKGV